MLAKERYQRILNQLNKTGAVTTTELTESLQVSVETVRRDLLHLEKLGQLQRVHGGAVSMSAMLPYEELPHRMESNPSGKAELCATAAQLVEEGDTIFIDSGSTAVFFAQALLQRSVRITIVTHSMDVFDILSGKDGFQVVLCGGFYDSHEKAFHGQLTIDMLKRVHVCKAFLCPSAVSITSGVWDYSYALIQIQQQALTLCDKVIILADSGKFEKNAMLKLCDITASHTFVTDSALPSHIKQLYLEQGVTVLTPKDQIICDHI